MCKNVQLISWYTFNDTVWTWQLKKTWEKHQVSQLKIHEMEKDSFTQLFQWRFQSSMTGSRKELWKLHLKVENQNHIPT